MRQVAEREVVIHEQITRGAEGMTSAYDAWWLRFMSHQFESEITVHQGGRSASVRNMLKFMGAFETPLLAGERVTVRAEGEDAERAVGFMAGVISGEIPREQWKSAEAREHYRACALKKQKKREEKRSRVDESVAR
jgi:phosphotransferase system HPr-like phosphotransfer protein